MRADMLHVVTAIYNPIRWKTRIDHYNRFRAQMLAAGVKLHVVECALGSRPFELSGDAAVTYTGVRADTLAWNKENLINLGLRGLPDDARYVAWVDADVEFRNPNWAAETVHSLQQYAVVQPWSETLDLGPAGEPMQQNGAHVQMGFAKAWRSEGAVRAYKTGTAHDAYSYPHPGYAWAIRRDVLNNIGGLIEASGLGAGDHQMAMAFIGNINAGAIHGQTSASYQAVVRAWCERAFKYVQGNLGFVQGTVEHWYHGEKAKRHYQGRWDILIRHGFDPVTDIKRNLHGVIELAGNKPAMERDFDTYFRQRDEDANTRGW